MTKYDKRARGPEKELSWELEHSRGVYGKVNLTVIIMKSFGAVQYRTITESGPNGLLKTNTGGRPLLEPVEKLKSRRKEEAKRAESK